MPGSNDADIKLLFGVSMDGDVSGDSKELIRSGLQKICEDLNKNPFKILFTADETALSKIKEQLEEVSKSLALSNINLNLTGVTSTKEGITKAAEESVKAEEKIIEAEERVTQATEKKTSAKRKSKKAAEEEAASEAKAAEEEEKRTVSTERFLKTYTEMLAIREKNLNAKEMSQFGNIAKDIGILSEVYNNIKGDTVSNKEVLEGYSEEVKEAFSRSEMSVLQFKAALQDTQQTGTLTYSKLLSSIESVEKALSSNIKNRSLPGYKDAEDLLVKLNNIKQAYLDNGRTVESFYNAITSQGLKASEVTQTVSTTVSNLKNQVYKVTNGVDYNRVLSTIKQINTLLKANPQLAGTASFTALEGIVGNLEKTIDRSNNKFKELDANGKIAGQDIAVIMDNASSEILNFSTAVIDSERNVKKAELTYESFVGKINSLLRSYEKASKAGLNDKTSDEAKAVLKYIQDFENARAEIKKSGKSVSEVLNSMNGVGVGAIAKSAEAMRDLENAVIKVNSAEAARIKINGESTTSEKERQRLLTKSYSLLNSIQMVQKNWTQAENGKTANNYARIKEYNSALRNMISRFKEGKMTASEFNAEMLKIGESFKSNAAIIKGSGENVKSFSDRLNNVARHFSMWISLSSMIMRAYRSIKEMINASIELDDAMTQLKIVTKESENTYEAFGTTVADVAKRTAASISDIVSSATVYARLGYSLNDATKIAEYTAKLQNVGDIEVSEAQDAITSILKAYDDIDADHIEEVMDKLVVTGNNFPISVSQIAEGMNNASSALAAAGNTFEQSVALLAAANTTVNLCRVA